MEDVNVEAGVEGLVRDGARIRGARTKGEMWDLYIEKTEKDQYTRLWFMVRWGE